MAGPDMRGRDAAPSRGSIGERQSMHPSQGVLVIVTAAEVPDCQIDFVMKVLFSLWSGVGVDKRHDTRS